MDPLLFALVEISPHQAQGEESSRLSQEEAESGRAGPYCQMAAAKLADIGGEELAQHCADWSLQQDRQLLDLLKSFSANIVDRTKRLEDKMDDLACQTNQTKVRLNNTLNELQNIIYYNKKLKMIQKHHLAITK